MHVFIGELHPRKKKKVKQEAINDAETTELGEEHSKKKKKKKKMKGEAADGESMACGKKVIIQTPCVACRISICD
jgi:hypothetical protein